MSKTDHNLNIHMYSFQEILDLFQLPAQFGEQDVKRAKMMVLKMHPDKSRLPPDYFLFYKKAFEFVLDHYRESIKTQVEVPNREIIYEPISVEKQVSKKIQSTVKEMGSQGFQNKFNELFEQNMSKRVDDSRNEWFKNNDPIYNVDESMGINRGIDYVKEKAASLVRYNGVQSMNSGSRGGNFYDDDNELSEEYVSCDPFGKLKYDDLRKVHKDQTVFSVGERDFEKVKTYGSVDQLQMERGSMNMTPLEKSEAERMLLEQERKMKSQMLAKQHADKLRSLEYEKKNKTVLSSFFQLTNGSL